MGNQILKHRYNQLKKHLLWTVTDANTGIRAWHTDTDSHTPANLGPHRMTQSCNNNRIRSGKHTYTLRLSRVLKPSQQEGPETKCKQPVLYGTTLYKMQKPSDMHTIQLLPC